MHGENQLLRTDALGRVWTPANRREELLDEFERSGVAARKFAQMVGIKYQTFASWRQRRRRQRDATRKGNAGKNSVAPAGMALRLVEAVHESSSPLALAGSGSGCLRVHLRCGAQLELADEKAVMLAAQLLRALETHSTAKSLC
jgi:hypothetical protein